MHKIGSDKKKYTRASRKQTFLFFSADLLSVSFWDEEVQGGVE